MTAGGWTLLLAGLTALASPASAGTWRVGRLASDCPGGCHFFDANSGGQGFGIRAAMRSFDVLPGDTVRVFPAGGATYNGRIDMISGVVLISDAGPLSTTITGNATSYPAILLVDTGPATEVRGFTIIWDSTTEGIGGGVAAYVSSGTVRDNIFRSNLASTGAAIHLQSSDVLVENNLFVSNNSTSGGGALSTSGGNPARFPTIRNNTFTANVAPFGYEGAVLYAVGSSFVFERNIVHGTRGGSAVFCGSGNTPTIACNLFWDNPMGSFAGYCVDSVGTSGNIAGDPLFCGVALGNYGLCADSPALSASCGTIGYVSPGGNCAACGPPPSSVLAATWGKIKSLYR